MVTTVEYESWKVLKTKETEYFGLVFNSRDPILEKAFQMKFDEVKNEENWKLPTIPITTSNVWDAALTSAILIHYTGGSEVTFNNDSWEFTISSKGYYEYIGA